MPRIDSLTAQMRQRSVKRVSVRADEKMKLYDDQGRLLGAGAALSGEVIAGILAQIAPSPLDGAPLAFPYSGRDGQFEISVEGGGQSFDVRALSFATTAPLQTHSQAQTGGGGVASQTASSPRAAPSAVAVAPPVIEPVAVPVEWFFLRGTDQVGENSPAQIRNLIAQGQIAPDTQLWTAGMAGWLPASQTEFAPLLPATVAVDYFGNPINPGGLAPMGGLAPIAAPNGASTPKQRTYGNGAYNIYGSGDDPNTSGTGNDANVPVGARGWFNLGAFLFPLWWCRAMNLPQYASAVTALNIASWFIPFTFFLKLPLCLYLALMGNRLAWQMRRFNDEEDFRKCQFLWGIWSIVANVVFWGMLFMLFILPAAQVRSSYRRSLPPLSSSGNGKPFGNLPPQGGGSGFGSP